MGDRPENHKPPSSQSVREPMRPRDEHRSSSPGDPFVANRKSDGCRRGPRKQALDRPRAVGEALGSEGQPPMRAMVPDDGLGRLRGRPSTG